MNKAWKSMANIKATWMRMMSLYKRRINRLLTRYKFTWFPKGVITNALSDAKYLKDGKVRPSVSFLDHSKISKGLRYYSIPIFQNDPQLRRIQSSYYLLTF